MRLSREKIQRMINAGGGSSSGGGGGSDIAGGVTQAWVNQNYVSIEFFRRVFKVWAAGETSSDPDVEIMPNDITTTVKNIQAQAGLWTEAFLSALGQGSGGGTGGATTLDQLDDVVITLPTNGQALIYNSATQMWVNGTIQSGTDMATVWSALAAATNEQINASHLSGVLADYVTTTSLQTILGDYLTQTAADQRYITIAYFDRLFRAYNGNTLVSHNDTTTTIDNIKAMFGFWTDIYISALGRNSAATGLGIDNLTDVTINTPTDGQVLQYNASTQKWINQTISITGNYLPLTGGTLTGDLFFEGYNNRVFGIKRTTSDTSTPVGTNIDIGWDWENRDGSGAFFRSSDAGDRAGDFGLFARNTTALCELLGKADGTLTWGNDPILTSANIKTINGQSIYGTGNIEVGGGASGNYLPLSGGTLTNPNYGGQLTIHRSVAGGNPAIKYTNSSGLTRYLGFAADASNNNQCLYYTTQDISYKYWVITKDWINNGFWAEKTDTSYVFIGASNTNQSVAILSATRCGFYYNTTPSTSGGKWIISYWSAYNKTYLECGNVLIGDDISLDTAYGRLHVKGSIYTNDRVIIGSGGTTSSTSLILTNNGQFSIAAAYQSPLQIGFRGGDYVLFINPSSLNVGIGESSPSYKLHVAGTIYATGAITALSDARKKDITGEAGVTVEQIAHAPAVQFLWKDKERRKDGQQVGTLAQYWRTVLPEVVMDKGGELSMQYGVAALVSAIVTARKVVDHEQRITELEKENERLRTEIEQLRLN